MFEQGVSEDFSFDIEAHEHFQITSKTTRHTLHSSAEIMALGVLCLIDDIGEFLTLGVVLTHGISLRHLQVRDTHHRLNTIGQSLGLLFGDRAFGQMVHIGQYAAHDNGNPREYQDHISQR